MIFYQSYSNIFSSNLDNLPFLSQMTYEGVVYLKRKPRIEVQGWSYVLHFLMRYVTVSYVIWLKNGRLSKFDENIEI